MTMDDAVKIISDLAKIDPKEMSFEDQLEFATAYLSYAKRMKPLHDKYCRSNNIDITSELIRAYLRERGEG